MKERLVGTFRKFCLQIAEMQSSNQKEAIAFIHFSLLRSSMLDRSFCYLIEAYSEQWYADEIECTALYDASWAFAFINNAEPLEAARKAYIQQIHAADVEQLLLKEVGVGHQFVAALFRSAIPLMVNLPEYAGIRKSDRLQIRMGEYQDVSEEVYSEDANPEHAEIIYAKLQSLQHAEGAYTSFKHTRFPPITLRQLDLRHADFSGSELHNSGFPDCNLAGTRWIGSHASHTDFSYSYIGDADFSNSELSGANFKYTNAAGLREGLIRSPGITGLNFTHANLEGANFSGFLFDRVDFTHANLKDALFLEADKEKLGLSEQQKAVVRWVHGGEE